MDNSQSSDVFSYEIPTVMDGLSYESLVTDTKKSLSKSVQKEIQKSKFPTYFSSVLEDCNNCISQSLDLVNGLLSDTDVHLAKLCQYIENAVSLLQLLSSFLKNVIESVSLTCCTMKTFPTTTGNIIISVFTHCKMSDNIYGYLIKNVEKQLKNLFRICHDLQITYLMILEKLFIFDLNEKEELDILIEALDINLKIGVVVQNLDVKTMAEQWKAYAMICEKHSNCLAGTQIFNNCTKMLCALIENNVKASLETNQEEKVVLRSLKVANFNIKILLRICNIFKHSTAKTYEDIVELLLYIQLNIYAYIELETGKPSHFMNLINSNISNPTEALLRELLMDEKFVNCVINVNADKLKKEDQTLGYILLMVSIMKSILQKSDDYKISKQTFLNSVFKLIPYGHIWFNMGLKFSMETQAETAHQTYGLYEHLLTHTFALSTTLDSEEFYCLELKMLEEILGTDCYGALFASNLWILLARVSSHLGTHQLFLNQLILLCGIYQKLEKHQLFSNSPQQVHLSYTIGRLFEVMQSGDKNKVYEQISLLEDKNLNLWSTLKVKNLPEDLQMDAEQVILEKCKIKFYKLFTTSIESSEEIDNLITTMKLAASCSFISGEDLLDNLVLKAWTKVCPRNKIISLTRGLDRGAVWYFDYIEALVSLTNSMKHIFYRTVNIVKVLHVVTNMIQVGNSELKLSLTNLLCMITLFPIHDENKRLADSLLSQALNNLLDDADEKVKNKICNLLSQNIHYKNVDNIISKVIGEDNKLLQIWNCFTKYGHLDVTTDWKKQLMQTMHYRYYHKCIVSKNIIELSDSSSINVLEKASNNFDFADIDSLFGVDSDSEPACKKVKLNISDAEVIITRLEKDTSLLCNIKENVFTCECKNRLRDVCEQLKNIID